MGTVPDQKFFCDEPLDINIKDASLTSGVAWACLSPSDARPLHPAGPSPFSSSAAGSPGRCEHAADNCEGAAKDAVLTATC